MDLGERMSPASVSELGKVVFNIEPLGFSILLAVS
jgi:hypothetical protein